MIQEPYQPAKNKPNLPKIKNKIYRNSFLYQSNKELLLLPQKIIAQPYTKRTFIKSVQCSINLTDILGQLVDGKLILPPSKIPLEPLVMVEQMHYDLRQRSATSTDVKRPKRKASSNVNYGNMTQPLKRKNSPSVKVNV